MKLDTQTDMKLNERIKTQKIEEKKMDRSITEQQNKHQEADTNSQIKKRERRKRRNKKKQNASVGRCQSTPKRTQSYQLIICIYSC